MIYSLANPTAIVDAVVEALNEAPLPSDVAGVPAGSPEPAQSRSPRPALRFRPIGALRRRRRGA